MSESEDKLVEIKYILDIYHCGMDVADDALEKIKKIINAEE